MLPYDTGKFHGIPVGRITYPPAIAKCVNI